LNARCREWPVRVALEGQMVVVGAR